MQPCEDELIKFPKCSHFIHQGCLENLLYTRLSKCPLCRSSIDEWRRAKHYAKIEKEIADKFADDTERGTFVLNFVFLITNVYIVWFYSNSFIARKLWENGGQKFGFIRLNLQIDFDFVCVVYTQKMRMTRKLIQKEMDGGDWEIETIGMCHFVVGVEADHERGMGMVWVREEDAHDERW